MPETTKEGTPYTGIGSAEVDRWSENIYLALSSWPIAQAGKWTRWEPGYLLLSIDEVEGEVVETIALYTADEEVTVEFGYWINHYGDLDNEEKAPESVARQARELVQQWVGGEFKTAVFTDIAGKWCGTILVEPGDVDKQLKDCAQRMQWIQKTAPARVELRSLRKSDWTGNEVDPQWLVSPKLSSRRLP